MFNTHVGPQSCTCKTSASGTKEEASTGASPDPVVAAPMKPSSLEPSSNNIQKSRGADPAFTTTGHTVVDQVAEAFGRSLSLEKNIGINHEAFNSVVPSVPKISVPKCHFLDDLPYEIRSIIYSELLIAEHPIWNAHELFESHRGINNPTPFLPDLHAAILRTCRTTYLEGLPTLYGRNKFGFFAADHLTIFAHGGLEKRVSGSIHFGFRLCVSCICNFDSAPLGGRIMTGFGCSGSEFLAATRVASCNLAFRSCKSCKS